MNSITQDINFKQSVIKYSYIHGVTAAALVYKLHRKTIYRWRERYDGTLKSLVNKSRRPHRSPRAHTELEIKMIKDYKNKVFVYSPIFYNTGSTYGLSSYESYKTDFYFSTSKVENTNIDDKFKEIYGIEINKDNYKKLFEKNRWLKNVF